jgi:HAD superfamily hydrolase (TIGR01490 family)
MSCREIVAVFDFDGTLIAGDSFCRFVTWHRNRLKVAIDLFIAAPLLALYVLRLVGNERHKMALFSRRYAGMRIEDFEALGRSFALEQLPAMVRKQGLERLRAHKNEGHRVVIVSASLETWIKPWAEAHYVDVVLASKPEVSMGRLTGRLAGANCFGAEKIRRLFCALPKDRSSYEIYAYGDSRGDFDLLAAADHAFLRSFL